MKVKVIGMGPGGMELLSASSARSICEAGLLIGSKRLLEGLPPQAAGTRIEAVSSQAVKDAIDGFDGDGCCCVLMSGDTGFYSGTTGLLDALRGYDVEVVPGISSVQMLSARLGRPWQSWKLVSAHGRECDPVSQVRANAETFFLTGGDWMPQTVLAALCNAGLGSLQASYGCDLGMSSESVGKGTAEELARMSFGKLTVLLVDNPAPDSCVFSGYPDDAFVRGAAPMTKSEVRAAIISKLRLEKGDIVYDVGAGTGSVSVEAARLASEGHVYAVEFKDDACDLVEENARRFNLGNLTLVRGMAPDALSALPTPDAAFIGGSSGNLEQIVSVILGKNPSARIVASSIALETLSEAIDVFARLPIEDVEVVQIAVSRAKEAGRYHLLMAQNPIFLISGRGAGKAAGAGRQ